MRTSYIYAAASGGYVKIGTSADPAVRMTQIPTSVIWPEDLPPTTPLEMLGHIEGGRLTEQQLHRTLAEARAAGEWFRRTPEVEKWLATLTPGFPEVAGVRKPMTLRLSMDLREKIDARAAAYHMSCTDWVTAALALAVDLPTQSRTVTERF